MFNCLTISMICFLISLILILLCSLISKKTFMDREKLSPFECGFDPMGSPRLPFSLRFFIIAVIFLIFDVEISILLPTSIILSFSNLKFWLMTTFMFILIVTLGLYYEWKEGALQWK